jgi:hypothetical protein
VTSPPAAPPESGHPGTKSPTPSPAAEGAPQPALPGAAAPDAESPPAERAHAALPTLDLPYDDYVIRHKLSGAPVAPPAEGRIRARLCVDTSGVVTQVTVTPPEEAPAASAILRGWRYRPFTRRGVPAPACFDLPSVKAR